MTDEYTFEDMLLERGYIVYTNVGTSMKPLLRQNRDIIVIRPRGNERCKKYDVVLYKWGTKYILHRIIKVCPDSYITAGDNNTFIEHGITDDIILGVMTRVIRDGKTVNMNDIGYKVYVHLWCDFYPFRILLFRVRNWIRKEVFILRKQP